MKKVYGICAVTALLTVAAAFCVYCLLGLGREEQTIKVGVVYISDTSTAYTENFVRATKSVKLAYGDRIEVVPKYNVAEGNEMGALQELADAGCTLIFTTSYGFGEAAKKLAMENPQLQVCQATCSNANTEPFVENYHTFMGSIHQGRFINGVVAGMKLRELMDQGRIPEQGTKVGYIGAFANPEVISGYTAFLLGVRSVVPDAVMEVVYTGAWSSYTREADAAKRLIADGCLVIGQHSDTNGAAMTCEATERSAVIYHVGSNRSVTDVAPTTALAACRINWEKYMSAAVGAVLDGKRIEDCVDANIHGNDAGAGFDKGWVEMLPLNDVVVAPGTAERVEELIGQFRRGKLQVFRGDLTGTDPLDPTDTVDLNDGYRECEFTSAPQFHYILQDVVEIVE